MLAPSSTPVTKVRAMQAFNEKQQAVAHMRFQHEVGQWRRGEEQNDVVARTEALRAEGVDRTGAIKQARGNLQLKNFEKVQTVKAEAREGRQRSKAQREFALARARASASVPPLPNTNSMQRNFLLEEQIGHAGPSNELSRGADLTNAAIRVRESELGSNRNKAAAVRTATRTGVTAGYEAVAHKHAAVAQSLRDEAEQGRCLRNRSEDEYLAHAREIRDARTATRAKIKEASLELQHRRFLVAEEKRRQTAEEEPRQEALAAWGESMMKEKVQDAHDTRFANVEEAGEYEESPLHRVRTPRWVQRSKEFMLGLWAPSPPHEKIYTTYHAPMIGGRTQHRGTR